MVKVFEGTDMEYYMDGYLKSNLDIAKKEIVQDWDMIFAVDGEEGGGKSVFAMQCARYCDPTFNLSRVAFTHKEFQSMVIKANKYEAIVYDEAYTGLAARAAMTRVNRALVQMLAEIRQKNLFIYVVMPTFFDLDRYVALWRSRGLFHIYTNDWERGYFMFYNKDRKKFLFFMGKKLYCYSKPKANFIGRFTNRYVVDENQYRDLKAKALKQREADQIKKQEDKEIEDAMMKRILLLPENLMSKAAKMSALGFKDNNAYYYALKKVNEELESGLGA